VGHELTVGGPGRGEVLVAFLELETQVDGLLFEVGDLLAEGIGVGGGAEPGLAPGLLAERFGQAFLELPDAGAEPIARSWAASRSACSDARVTAGPVRLPVAGGAASRAWILPSRSRCR
jgi:hypothetical protein